MKRLLLGSTLLLLLLLALSDGVLGAGKKPWSGANTRDQIMTIKGKSKRNGAQKGFQVGKTLLWKRPEYVVNTDTVIVKYTQIFLTAKAKDKFKVKDVSTVLEPLLTDHAVNVLKVAFFFRRLLAEDYPPDNRKGYIKPFNAVGRNSRQISHQIKVLWDKLTSKEEGEGKPFKQTEDDKGVAAREEIKQKQKHLLFEATQGRVLLEKIIPDDEFESEKVKELANKLIANKEIKPIGEEVAKTSAKPIEQEVRDELFKVGTRGLDNLAALGNGKEVRDELLKMVARMVDNLVALAQKEGGNAEATIEALEDFSDVHVQLSLDELKEHRKTAASPADQPGPFGGDELIKVVTRVVDKLVAQGKQDRRKAKATIKALKPLFAHFQAAYDGLKQIADQPGPSGGPEIQEEGS